MLLHIHYSYRSTLDSTNKRYFLWYSARIAHHLILITWQRFALFVYALLFTARYIHFSLVAFFLLCLFVLSLSNLKNNYNYKLSLYCFISHEEAVNMQIKVHTNINNNNNTHPHTHIEANSRVRRPKRFFIYRHNNGSLLACVCFEMQAEWLCSGFIYLFPFVFCSRVTFFIFTVYCYCVGVYAFFFSSLLVRCGCYCCYTVTILLPAFFPFFFAFSVLLCRSVVSVCLCEFVFFCLQSHSF